MLRQQIKISPSNIDANVKLKFQSQYLLGGLSEDIEHLVTKETGNSINDTTDGEKLRFTPLNLYLLGVNFYNTTASAYQTNVAPNEFTSNDVNTLAFVNSFYVYKIYDSPIENTQNLIYTGYLNGTDFIGFTSNGYPWNNKYEYGDIHVPYSIIHSITGTTLSMYMKMNFYSAKTTKIYPFSSLNPLTTNPLNEIGLYNKLTLNVSTKQYTITSPFLFFEITNASYVNNINDSVTSLAVEIPTYPSGNTFTNDGHYITVG